jgi:hypothetical protein
VDAGLGPEDKDSSPIVCEVRALLRADRGTNADDACSTANSREIWRRDKDFIEIDLCERWSGGDDLDGDM